MKTLKGHSKNQLEKLFRKQMKNGEKRAGGGGGGEFWPNEALAYSHL